VKPYLCLLAGIHDVPGNRRHGETVIADCGAAALAYAAGRYGLSDVPPGSSAVALRMPPA
jgi:hypothetical protein